jgi:hypothetical protein
VVAEDFLQDAQVRQWLDGVEPAWTLLTFDSLRALRQEPSASQTAIRIANDLDADEIAGSAVAPNTLTQPNVRVAISRSLPSGPRRGSERLIHTRGQNYFRRRIGARKWKHLSGCGAPRKQFDSRIVGQ